MAPCTQLPVWTAWHFARVQLPFRTAGSLTFYHLSCHCFLSCLHLIADHLKGRKCSFLAPSECLGSSGSLELLLRVFASVTGEGMWELEVGLEHFRSSANACHLKDAENVTREWLIEQDCRRRVMKTNIHLAALPGQFHVTSHVVHPRNPFGVTLPAGDTHSATLSVFFVSWLHSLWVNVRAGTACESLECGKMMKLQHLALSSLPEQNN